MICSLKCHESCPVCSLPTLEFSIHVFNCKWGFVGDTQVAQGNLGEHSFIFTGGLSGIVPQRLSTRQVRGEFLWLRVMEDGNSTFFGVSQGHWPPLCRSIIYMETSEERSKSSLGTCFLFLTKQVDHLVFSSTSAGAMESSGQEGAEAQGSLSASVSFAKNFLTRLFHVTCSLPVLTTVLSCLC